MTDDTEKPAATNIARPLAVRGRSGRELHRYDTGTRAEDPDGTLAVVKHGQPAVRAPGTRMLAQHEPARVPGHIAELPAQLRQSQAKQAADRDTALAATSQGGILATALRQIIVRSRAGEAPERIAREALRAAGL